MTTRMNYARFPNVIPRIEIRDKNTPAISAMD